MYCVRSDLKLSETTMPPPAPKKKKTKAEREAERLAYEEEQRKLRELEQKRIEEENERLRQEAIKLQQYHDEQRRIELERLKLENDVCCRYESENLRLFGEELIKEHKKQQWESFREAKEESILNSEKQMNHFLSTLQEDRTTSFHEANELITQILHVYSDILFKLYEISNEPYIEFSSSKVYYYDYLNHLYHGIVHHIDTSITQELRYTDKYLNSNNEVYIEKTFGSMPSNPTTTNNSTSSSYHFNRVNMAIHINYSDNDSITATTTESSNRIEFNTLGWSIQKFHIGEGDTSSMKSPEMIRILEIPIDAYTYNNNHSNIHVNTSSSSLSLSSPTASNTQSVPVFISDINTTTTTNNNNNNNKMSGSQQYYIVGNIYHFDMFQPPLLPKQQKTKKWTIRPFYAPGTILPSIRIEKNYYYRMTIKLPTSIVMTSDLYLGKWDAHTQSWNLVCASIRDTTNTQSSIVYIENSHSIEFHIYETGIYACLRNKYSELPYQSWSISPIYDNSMNTQYDSKKSDNKKLDIQNISSNINYMNLNEFHDHLHTNNQINNIGNKANGITNSYSHDITSNSPAGYKMYIVTQYHEIVLHFKYTQCCLLTATSTAPLVISSTTDSNSNIHICSDLYNQYMSPQYLLFILQKRGINLLISESNPDCYPKNYESQQFHFILKDNKLEQHTLYNMIKWLPLGTYSSTLSWNQVLPYHQIGITIQLQPALMSYLNIPKVTKKEKNDNSSIENTYEIHSVIPDDTNEPGDNDNTYLYILSEVDQYSESSVLSPTISIQESSSTNTTATTTNTTNTTPSVYTKYTLVEGLIVDTITSTINTTCTSNATNSEMRQDTITTTATITTTTDNENENERRNQDIVLVNSNSEQDGDGDQVLMSIDNPTNTLIVQPKYSNIPMSNQMSHAHIQYILQNIWSSNSTSTSNNIDNNTTTNNDNNNLIVGDRSDIQMQIENETSLIVKQYMTLTPVLQSLYAFVAPLHLISYCQQKVIPPPPPPSVPSMSSRVVHNDISITEESLLLQQQQQQQQLESNESDMVKISSIEKMNENGYINEMNQDNTNRDNYNKGNKENTSTSQDTTTATVTSIYPLEDKMDKMSLQETLIETH